MSSAPTLSPDPRTPGPPGSPPPPRRLARRLTRRRVLLWLSVVFVVTLVAGAVVLYVERQALAERIIRSALADMGLESGLEVDGFGLNGITLRDLTLREDGTEVLRADSVRVGYVWREMLDGRARTVDVRGARVVVGLDEDLAIAEGWLRPEGGGGGAALPEITVADSVVDLRTPYGEAEVGVEADMASLERFTARLDLSPARFVRDGLVLGLGGGEIALERAGERVGVVGGVALDEVSRGDLSAFDGALAAEGRFDLAARRWRGTARLGADRGAAAGGRFRGLDAMTGAEIALDPRSSEMRLSGPVEIGLASWERGPDTAPTDHVRRVGFASPGLRAALGDVPTASGPVSLSVGEAGGFDTQVSELSVEGRVERLSLGERLELDARLDVQAGAARLDAARARALAEALTVSGALGDTPVTRDFVPGLVDAVARALRGGALSAPLDVRWGATTELALRGPLAFGPLRVSPVEGAPLYRHDPALDALRLRLNASLPGARALRVSDLDVEAASASGLAIDAVEALTMRLRTDAWTAATPDGRPTTLAPVDARVDVDPLRTRVTGALAFTGDVPGAYVTGLEADGVLTVRPGAEIATGFASDTPIRIARANLPTGAVVEDFAGTLVSDGPVFRTRDGEGRVTAELAGTSLRYLFEGEDGTAQAIDLAAARVDASGELRPTGQDWTLALGQARVATDTLLGTDEAGAGTVVEFAEAALEAGLEEGGELRFAFASPALDARTPLVGAAGMSVEARGTLADYEVAFDGARVDLPDTLPGGLPEGLEASVPVSGTARFARGRWTGDLDAALPGAADVPALVEFDYGDGDGSAHIVVAGYVFDPDGLQPQDLVPALRGKISRVAGPVDADVRLVFRDGAVVESPGTVELDGLELGTAPGPMTGLRTRLDFASMLPLDSSGIQTATLELFDPGIPLRNGTFRFEFKPTGIRIHSASWPLGGGEVRLEPLLWTYGAEVNRAELVVEGVPVGEFLAGIGAGRVEVEGVLSGRLPVEVRGIEVEVRDGRLEVPNGGVIRYESPQTDTAAAQDPLTQAAFSALREFGYDRLALAVDGPLDGEITVEIAFGGTINPTAQAEFTDKVRNDARVPVPGFLRFRGGIPFEFDISITGELFNILKSLNPGQYTDSAVLERFRSAPEAQPEPETQPQPQPQPALPSTPGTSP